MKSHCVDDVSTHPILGDDAVSDILSRLPVKSLMRFKCVCKSWLSLIESDPHFADLQFTQSKTRPVVLISSTRHVKQGTSFFFFDHGSAIHHVTTTPWTRTMLRPINGLICFVDYKEASVLIYNLSTREATPWIPTTSIEKEQRISRYNCPSYGFGFDPTTKQHKVIWFWETISYCSIDHQHRVCEVLTVGHNSWRRIHEVPPYKLCGDSIYANGSMYWLVKTISSLLYDDTFDEVIVEFNVGSEKFRIITIPKFIFHHHLSTPLTRCLRSSDDLLEVDGGIALLHRTIHDETNVTFKIWKFDDKEKEKSTSRNWIEESILMSCDLSREWLVSFEAIAGTDLILAVSLFKWRDPSGSVYYYDRKKRTSRKVDIISTIQSGGFSLIDPKEYPANYCHIFGISTFVESIFPVKNQQQQHPLSLLSPRN